MIAISEYHCSFGFSGKAMKAKDTLYHEEGCFVCAECSLDLREVAVYAKDAALYCEKHYKEKFVPKCARCLDYITEVSQHYLPTSND